MITESKRVLSLLDPSEKMSKSAPNPASRILITDSPEMIAKKIKSAVTDSDRSISFDPEERKGVANLLTILAACSSGHNVPAFNPDGAELTPEQVVQKLQEQNISGHAQLKQFVTDAVVEKLRGIQEEYTRLRGDVGYLREVAKEGKEQAQEVASRTMVEVRRKVGLGPI